MRLGDRLRAAREEKGLKGYQLAELVGADSGTLSRWETGARKPRSEAVRRLATALGVRMEWLLTGEEPREAAATALAPLLLGVAALDHVLATYTYPPGLSMATVDSIEESVRGEVAAHPRRSPAAWRYRLDALCEERRHDSRPRAKAR